MKFQRLGLATTLALWVAITATNATADHIATFSDLFSGNSLIDGNTTYSNFELVSDFGTVQLNFDDIQVEGIGNGLEFSSQNEFFLFPGDDSIILQFSFDVSPTVPGPGQPLFTAGASSFASDVPFIMGDGVADLFTEFSTPDGELLATTNAILDPAFGIEQLFDEQGFGSAEEELRVQANLSLFADGDSLVALRSFQITTTAVPEPGITSALGVLLSSVLFTRRRRSILL